MWRRRGADEDPKKHSVIREFRRDGDDASDVCNKTEATAATTHHHHKKAFKSHAAGEPVSLHSHQIHPTPSFQ